jgi:hypothetical protein
MLDPKNINHQVRFKGVINESRISNKQQGPTCGFEAIANIIELCRPEYAGKDLVKEDLLGRAQGYRAVDQQGTLAIWAYQRILKDYLISSLWYPFDHYQIILPALLNNLGMVIVGDAYFLNSEAYKRSGSHAFVLTNYYTEESGHYSMGYTRIDSNFSFQSRGGQFREGENFWPYQRVENAARGLASYCANRPVLITSQQLRWSDTARHYRRIRSGQFLAVPY